jgi:formyl-CoA transferase
MTEQSSYADGPLTGLRVLELGSLIAGPFCGQLLADMGAEVIKVEPPGQGDPMRAWGKSEKSGKSLAWPVIARNKKSITLNLRVASGQALLKRLVAHTDVLIENFRPGTLEAWGLGYEALHNPRLIMARISGYGQTGPYAKHAGFGSIGEAMGGLRYIVGDPTRPPSRVGISIGDSLAATFACLGTLAALRVRDATGRGQIVDCALYEAVLSMMESLVTEYDQDGVIRERAGAILPRVAPSNVYSTRDGMVLIAANQNTVFARLCGLMGAPDKAEDARYATHTARGQHQAELDHWIDGWTRSFGTDELLAQLAAAGVPAGRIYRAPDMLQDPHFIARESIATVEHPEHGALRMQNVTPRLSETPGGIRSPSPALGQHNGEVYGERLGLDASALADLAREGVI